LQGLQRELFILKHAQECTVEVEFFGEAFGIEAHRLGVARGPIGDCAFLVLRMP